MAPHPGGLHLFLPRPVHLAVLFLTLPVLAGCLTPPSATLDPAEGIPLPLELPALDLGHDHADPALHPERAHGMTRLTATRLAEDGHAARMVLAEGADLLIVSLAGKRAGLVAVDVSDPVNPVALGSYRSDYGASEGEAVAVTPDGKFAFLGIETTYSNPPVAPMIEVVSLADPAAPKLAARVPAVAQPHVLTFMAEGSGGYLVVSDYQLTVAASGLLPESSAVSAGVSFYQFSPGNGALVHQKRHTFDVREKTPGPFFTHDPVVVTHPVTGERLLYLAAFGGGGRILTAKDPASVKEIGVALDAGSAPVLRHHSFVPGPVLVEEVLPTAAIPRSRAADGAAYLTFYDTADPTAPVFLGEWRHPDPDLAPGDAPPLNLHVPVFAKEGTRLLVPHFHAGLYVFDTSTRAALEAPKPVAYWMPPAGDVPAGAPHVGVVAMALEVKGTVLAVEAVTSTLYALTLDA